MESPCTLLIHAPDRQEAPNVGALKALLQNGTVQEKIAAMKQTIVLTVNGEAPAGLPIVIFQCIMTQRDHTLKKLLLLYLEVCEKTNKEGKLLPEMILVCNALLNDLNHPNEYIRGCALRFASKLKEVELLEPLVPSIKANLENRHAYVKRNAVLAIFSIYNNFEYLLPDAPEVIFDFLQKEGDSSCQRNAFLMLLRCSQPKVVEYLETVTAEQVLGFADALQMMIVELIRHVWHSKPDARAKYLQCAFAMLNSPTPSVQFESATTLISMTSAPTAVNAAASTLIKLLCNESDINVKLIVLDRLMDISSHHQKVMQGLVMDLLRALACPNMEIRKKTLSIALELITPSNVDEAIMSLKREINKDQVDEGEYRPLLIRSIHTCATRFPGVAKNVVHNVMEFLGDTNILAAVDVIAFVREVIQTYPGLRQEVLKGLIGYFKYIKSSRVLRAALWIVGEYAQSPEEIDQAFGMIKEQLGEVHTNQNAKEKREEEEKKGPKQATTPNNRILSDGSYATQSALTEEVIENVGSPLHHLIVFTGDFFLASVLATTLTKLVIRSYSGKDIEAVAQNTFCAEVLILLTDLIKLGESDLPKSPIDPDSHSRICLCIKTLSSPQVLDFGQEAFLNDCRQSFANLLLEQRKEKDAREASKTKKVEVQADDLIPLHYLAGKKLAASAYVKDAEAIDLIKATGFLNNTADEGQRLERLFQLTGWSDPVYAEAYINVQQYDIMLEVLVLNRTSDTLQNVSMELSMMGDLKLCERPQWHTVGPFGSVEIKADLKVSSTETGVIFGNLVYDVAGGSGETNYVALNDIHIDILDYINPAYCSHPDFRAMWGEFEWENKVVVNTNYSDLNEYLDHIMKVTNMNCLTPKKALAGDCGFLAANLYARSVFGEDALANLSIEKYSDGKIQGFIRIRSKAQGIALSLGDKINLHQNRP